MLHFPPNRTGQPVVCRLVKDFGLTFNIIRASVSPGQEGLLVLELSGERKNYDKGIKYLKETGIEIQSLSQDVVRDEVKCTHLEPVLPFVLPGPLSWNLKPGRCSSIITNVLSAGYVSRLVLPVPWSCMSDDRNPETWQSETKRTDQDTTTSEFRIANEFACDLEVRN